MGELVTKHIRWVITFIALLLAFGFVLLAIVSPPSSDWRSTWLNLAAECLGMAGTVWIVDRLLEIKRRKDEIHDQAIRLAWTAVFKIEKGVEEWLSPGSDIEIHELTDMLNKVKERKVSLRGSKEGILKLGRVTRNLLVSQDETLSQCGELFPQLNEVASKLEGLQKLTPDEDIAQSLIDSLNLLFAVTDYNPHAFKK